MKYHFKVHKDSSSGFWGECVELKGCHSQGESLEELQKNLEEALNVYLAEPADSNVVFPFPKKIVSGRNIVEVRVDSKTALAMVVRQTRLRQKKSQREMMKFLGLKSLSAYQRFEDPRRANLELETMDFLKRKLPELNLSIIF